MISLARSLASTTILTAANDNFRLPPSPAASAWQGRLVVNHRASGTLPAFAPHGATARQAETRTNGSTVLATTYSYDAASRVATITYPDSSLVTYTRDAMGKITSLTDKPSGGTATTIASSIAYEPFGPVSSFTYGNGLTSAITLDADYRTTQIVDNGTGSTHIQNIAYSLNAGDMPTQYTDNLNSTNSLAYIGYDGMERMDEFYAYSGGGVNYPTYDHNGNRTAYYALTYTYNSGTSQLKTVVNGGTTTTVTTSGNGNITAFSPAFGSAAVTGLSYNNANELASVSGSGGTLGSYVYDALGQRFSKTVGSTTTMYQYSQGSTLLAEASGTSETNYIYVNGKPVAMLTGSTFTWLHTNHLGTPQVATNSSQSVVRSSAYLPFGEPNGTSGSATVNLRMPGQYFDAESGFSHNGARDYVPALGRYVESDPIGIYDFGFGEGTNPYNYAGQNPMHVIDPSGLSLSVPSSTLGQNTPSSGGKTCYWDAGGGDGTLHLFSRTYTASGYFAGPQVDHGTYNGPEIAYCTGETSSGMMVAGDNAAPSDDSLSCGKGSGERGATGGSSGQNSDEPYKNCKTDPNDPKYIICRHYQTGKKIRKPKPADFPPDKMDTGDNSLGTLCVEHPKTCVLVIGGGIAVCIGIAVTTGGVGVGAAAR